MSLSVIMERIEEKVELPEDMYDITSDELFYSTYGLSGEDVEDYRAKINGSGIKCDEIVLVQTSGGYAVSRVEQSLRDRLSDVQNQMKDYLPEQYEIARKCSVITLGDTVALFISRNAGTMTQILESEIKG